MCPPGPKVDFLSRLRFQNHLEADLGFKARRYRAVFVHPQIDKTGCGFFVQTRYVEHVFGVDVRVGRGRSVGALTGEFDPVALYV